MRRRLFWAAAPLLVALFAAISVPAATALAGRHTAAMTNDRINDASRFAAAAFTALAEDDTTRLEAELDQYADLFDSPVWLLDNERNLLHATAGDVPPDDADDLIDAALAGSTPGVVETIWPWGPAHAVIATPVGRDSQVLAAIVIEVPTDATRSATLRDWAVLALALTVAGGVAMFMLWPASRWVLKPVADLERSADAVAGGDLEARAIPDAGPPELQGLSRTFNHMVDRVAGTVERQQRFVADASHQLRNPLASIRLAVDNLEPHLDGTDDAREVHGEAVDDIERMNHVVEGLLAATRLEDRTAGHVRLGDVVESLRPGWASLADRDEVHIDSTLDDGVVVVEPTGGLASVLEELVDNAVRLGEAHRIEVSGRPEAGDTYVVTVADDGGGMTEEERSQALERFWRSPRVQNVPGTGLGLAITAQVVADVGGEVRLDASETGGLAVHLALPRPEQ